MNDQQIQHAALALASQLDDNQRYELLLNLFTCLNGFIPCDTIEETVEGCKDEFGENSSEHLVSATIAKQIK